MPLASLLELLPCSPEVSFSATPFSLGCFPAPQPAGSLAAERHRPGAGVGGPAGAGYPGEPGR